MRESPICPVCRCAGVVLERPYRAVLPGSQDTFGGLSILRCDECHLRFAHPIPSREGLQTYYETAYRAAGSLHRVETDPGGWSYALARVRSQYAFIASRVHPDRFNAVRELGWLDIGAGYGFLLDAAKSFGFRHLAGVEPDQNGRDCLIRKGHTVIDSLDHVTGKWGIVTFSHVLEHVDEPTEFLRRVWDLLHERGYVFCEVPNEAGLKDASNDAPHLMFFTSAPLRTSLERAGFRVLSVASCGRVVGGDVFNRLSSVVRFFGLRLLSRPPRLLDPFIFPHFRYSRKRERAWLRLLAQKIP